MNKESTRELPIVLDGNSVCAVLAGRKTQILERIAHAAPYHRGDLLWVQEAWLELDPEHVYMGERYYYRAGFPAYSDRLREEYGYEWQSPESMPQKAARLWLRVTDVRAERLQGEGDDWVWVYEFEVERVRLRHDN